MSENVKKAGGKQNMVVLDPGRPIDELTDAEIDAMAGALYDELSAQRDQHRRSARRTG